MQSPKFRFLQSDLGDVFQKSSLLTEWKKRVLYQLRKQLIFDPIEYRDLSRDIDTIVSQLRSEVLSGSYSSQLPMRYLAEKSRGLCRQMTLVHPRDLLVLERLSRSIYFELRDKAPSKSAFFEPDDGNFKKGIQQADTQYGSFASWKKFQKAVFGFANENKYVVVTDVANFYDFINFQHLRNIVASLANIRESVLDLLIFTLNRLTWNPDFMPLTQIGMPQIETSATRVLANAMLYEVDKVCETSAIRNYARFMDDMDIGVGSISEAKRVVRDVDLTLQSRQLRLNSSKTKILDQMEAYEHFCIEENLELSRIEFHIEKNTYPALAGKIAIGKYERWLDRALNGAPGPNSRFRRGNGPKIHKYSIKLVYQSGGRVPDEDLLWLVEHDPGMRSFALKYLAYSSRKNRVLDAIMRILRKGVIVDDASIVDISSFMLHARFRRTQKSIRLAREFCQLAVAQGDVGLHSALFVASKFLFRAELLRLMKINRSRIVGNFWLCRAVGGLLPLFLGHPRHISIYKEYVMMLGSEDAYRVSNYLIDASRDTTFDRSLSAYINARNDTYPQSIYFPKILMLLAVSRNPNLSTLFPDMFTVHPALKDDPDFRHMGF